MLLSVTAGISHKLQGQVNQLLLKVCYKAYTQRHSFCGCEIYSFPEYQVKFMPTYATSCPLATVALRGLLPHLLAFPACPTKVALNAESQTGFQLFSP
jgi:hypothetical protein